MTQQNAYPRFEAKEWNADGATQFYGREKAQLYCGGDPLRGNPGGFTPAGRGQGVGLPYYRSTFVRKKGRYYYADNDLPFLVAESENPRVIGGKTTNYYMLEVTYWKDRISFA